MPDSLSGLVVDHCMYKRYVRTLFLAPIAFIDDNVLVQALMVDEGRRLMFNSLGDVLLFQRDEDYESDLGIDHY